MIRCRAGSDNRTDQLRFTQDQSLLYPLLPIPPWFLPGPLPLNVPSPLFMVLPTPASIPGSQLQRLTLCQRLLMSDPGNGLFDGHKAYMWVVGRSKRVSLLPGGTIVTAGEPQERARRTGETGKEGAMDLSGLSGRCTVLLGRTSFGEGEEKSILGLCCWASELLCPAVGA